MPIWLIFAAEQLAGYFLGLVVGFFGVAQPVMIIFAFIPWTLSLRREGALRNLAPLRRYIFAFTYLSLFLVLASWLVFRFAAPVIFGYIVGLLYTFVRGLRSCRRTLPTFSEYIKVNAEDFDPTYVSQVFGMEGTGAATPKA
jgi:hypothetical protein